MRRNKQTLGHPPFSVISSSSGNSGSLACTSISSGTIIIIINSFNKSLPRNSPLQCNYPCIDKIIFFRASNAPCRCRRHRAATISRSFTFPRSYCTKPTSVQNATIHPTSPPPRINNHYYYRGLWLGSIRDLC